MQLRASQASTETDCHFGFLQDLRCIEKRGGVGIGAAKRREKKSKIEQACGKEEVLKCISERHRREFWACREFSFGSFLFPCPISARSRSSGAKKREEEEEEEGGRRRRFVVAGTGRLARWPSERSRRPATVGGRGIAMAVLPRDRAW